MKKFYLILLAFVAGTVLTSAQQLPNSGFEDWSGEKFDGNIQPKSWNYSNVTQFGFKFNFAHQEKGHTGNYCAMVQDQEVGAAGITETSPGYISLGQPWVYIKSLTTVNQATAGDKGSISWKTRPDTMQVWIKRTGDRVKDEDFHLLFYSWKGTAKGSKYQGKNESCTSVGESYIDEESDVRQALDANKCGTDEKATQIAEGWWRERQEYGSWTCINVPIYYFNDEVPEKCNVIFSASNYPNFRANSGLFPGNSLYVDDIKMIYSSQIQSLYVGGKKWNGFVPTSTEEQEYSLGQGATEIPEIYAVRGQGELTNTKGQTATFPGRKLTSSECVINYGTIDGTPTTITVKAEDGSSTTVYKIKFVRAASTNSRLGGIQVNGTEIAGFNAYKFDYTYELPYGTTATPVLTVTPAEDAQNVTITQANGVNGTATVKVVAADKKTTSTYTVKFSVAKLSDNTLKDITLNGESLKGFLPTKTLYNVELPLETTAVPDIKAVSAYKAGEQTIEYNNQGLDKTFEIKVTAPGNPNSRTYKLNFKITASSYVYLSDLKVAGYEIGFEQTKKVYYVSLPVGTATLPEVTYVAGDKYQTITKVTEVDTDNPDRTWVKLTVTAGNGTDQLIYKVAFDIVRSTITTLDGIALDGKALAGFDANTYRYDVELPIGTTKLPTVTYTKGDPLQTVEVKSTEIDKTDHTASTRLTVTADNGDQAVYVINYTVAQADNTTLLMIFVNGTAIENFDPNVRNYDCVLPLGTKTWPTVTWTVHDEWQTVATRQGTFNASKTNVMKINVTSGANTAGTYELSFTVAAASKNTALKSIAVNGTNIPDFSATTYAYNYKLPMGTTSIPVVSAEKAETAQTVTVTQAKSVTGTATIKVVAEDKSVYKNYTVSFSVEASSNVALKSISVGGTKIAGFDPEVLEYNIELPAGTKVLPDITCETDGYQTVSVRNELVNLTGDYKLVVTAPSGASRTYILHISVVTSSNADLNMIYSGGTKLADFNKNKTEYVIGLPVGTTTVPALTYDKGEEGQTVNVNAGGLDGVTEIIVRAADGKTTKTYSITYVIEKATNTTLTAIKVGGTLIAGFNPEVTNYTYDLTSKTTVLPAVTYEAHDAYQTIVAQTDYMTGLEGDYKIIVRAQSGDTRTYTITFRVVISSNSQLQAITLDGAPLAGFDAAKKDYNIELPIGTTVLPTIAYIAGDDAQTITLNKGDVNGKTTIVVKAENGTTSTYTLNFTVKKANDTTLKSIMIDGVEISGFRADSTYYEVDLKSTTTVLPTVTFEKHDEWQTVNVRTDDMDGLTGTYKLVVLAQTGETRVYSIKFSIVISSNAALGSISIDGEKFTEYTPGQLDYTYYLDLGTTKAPEITYEAGDEFQVITENFRGLTGRNEIIVIAQDGTKRTYSITFIVAKSNKTHLDMITVDGHELSDFSFDKSDYTVELKNAEDHGRTTVPVIGFTKAEKEQQVSVVYGSINGVSKVVVVAENGTDSRTYTLRFQLPISDNCTLNNITIGAGSWSGFSKETTTYSIVLPIGTTALPEINVDKGDEWQNVIISRGTVESATTIMVIAENGDRKEYTLNFSVAKSAEAQVEMIALGNQNIPAFSPAVYSYVFQLDEGVTECPDIVVTKKDDSQQVTIVKPANTGKATVICVAENGTQSTYTIDVRAHDTRSDNCKLANLTLDGTMIEGFSPTKMEYKYVLPAGSTELPAIDWELGESHQNVAVTRGTVTDTTYIRVLAENKTDFNIYKIAFSVAPYSDAQLKELWVGAEDLLAAAINQTEFTVNLDKAATTCPVIRPVAMDHTQAIVMTTPVFTGDALIKVLSAAGEEKDYTIHFVSTRSNDVTLKSISINGTPVDSFDPDNTYYPITLPSGTTAMPTVTWELNDDATQTAEFFAGGVNGTSVIRVVAEDGSTQEYTLDLTAEQSDVAEVAWIKLDNVALDNFSTSTLNYDYELPEDATKAPVITAEATSPEQQIVIVQPELTGKALVQVLSEDDFTSKTYTINIHFAQKTDATLKSIAINGEEIEGYNPSTFTYHLTRTTDKIANGVTITYEKQDATQTVIVENNNAQGAKLFVTAENGDKATYEISYTVTPSSNAQLNGIRFFTYTEEEGEIRGRYTDYADFEPTTDNYTYSLPRLSKAVPAIYPLKAYDAQRVTINYGKVNEATTILVVAEDGTTKTYTINFPVTKSSNTALKSLAIMDVAQDVNQTEIEIALEENWRNDYPSVQAMIKYEAEPEQGIEYVSAPFDKASTIKVTAEDGSVRTYRITFKLPVPEGDNVLKAIAYQYKNAAGNLIDGTIDNPQLGNNTVNLPFGSQSFTITSITKNYDKQTISWINAGIRRPTTIAVQSNKEGVDDAEYVVTPVMPEFDTTGKLQDLKFQGITISNFKPYIYSYMVGVTAQPAAEDFVGTDYNNNTITGANFNAAKKQVTLTVEGGQTYSVCWFYYEDEWPFTYERVQTEKAYWYEVSTFGGIIGSKATKKDLVDPTGYKPRGWKVPADLLAYIDYNATVSHFTYYTGHEVTVVGERELTLSTLRGGALNSSMPGTMTLGGLSFPNDIRLNGGTTVAFEKNLTHAVQYRNTPEQFQLEYQPIMTVNGINTWNAWVALGNASGTVLTQKDISGSYNNMGKWQTSTTNLSYSGQVGKLNIMLCASEVSGNSYDIHAGSTAVSADLQIRNMRMVYSSELTAVKVNGKDGATPSGTTFTYTLAEGEVIVGVPALTFTQKVQDQTRKIEWLNNGEWIDGKLTAKVTNYGENFVVSSPDSTVYYVVLQRPAVTDLSITVNDEVLTPAELNISKILPNGTRRLPDLNIVPASIHQKVTVTRKNWAYTITVENESGETATYNYTFVEDKSSSTDISVEMAGITFDPAQTEYNVTADAWAGALTFEKSTDGQIVSYSSTDDARTITVTSEDGNKKTYTINRISEQKSSGNLSKVYVNTTSIEPVEAEMSTSAEVTRGVAFIRQEASETVQQIFAADTVYWTVTANAGGSNSYYLAFEHEKSSETKLKSILVNGQLVKDFDPMVYTGYRAVLDTKSLTLDAEPLDNNATLAIDYTGNAATITVTAEDGTVGETYKVSFTRPVETNATLKAIYLDGVALPNFNPYLMDYSINLPITTPKMAEPVIPAITFEGGADAQTYSVENLGTNVYITVTAESGDKNDYSLTFSAEPDNETSLKALFVNGHSLLQVGHTEYSVVLPNEDEPMVAYYAMSPYQTVTLIPHASFDDQDMLTVTAESGAEKTYFISYTVDPLFHSAQLKGLILDRDTFADFRSDIYSYIIPIDNTKSAIPNVEAILKHDDQQVVITPAKINEATKIEVTAPDGVTKQTYSFTFQETKSSDASLLGISVDYEPITPFDKDQLEYTVEADNAAYTIQAVQSNFAQKVMQVRDGDLTKLIVVAEDGTTRTYSVKVDITESSTNSSNAYLQAIVVGGEPIAEFRKDSMFYTVDLPEGTTTLPDLTVEAGATGQTITFSFGNLQTSTIINVLAKNGVSSRQYGVRYNVKTSDVDSLKMIYMDGQPIADFDSKKLDYALDLERRAFPYVTFEKGIASQTVIIDTLSSNAYTQRLALRVKAASGAAQRTYNLTMNIKKATADTLRMIYLDGQPMAEFESQRNNYDVVMPLGSTSYPEITWTEGDDFQNVIFEVQAAAAGTATYALRVTAESGTVRIYSMNLSIAKSELTDLRNILVNGETLVESGKGYTADKSFSADEHRYSLAWNIGTVDIPQITYTRGDTYQHVEMAHQMSSLNDSVVLRVVAENGESATYVINSELKHSDVDVLKMIYINNSPLENFDALKDTFIVDLPVGTRNFPTYEAVRGDQWQIITTNPVDITTYRAEYAITVLAENGNKRIYTLIFNVAKSENSALNNIRVNGESVAANGLGYKADFDFDPEQLDYNLAWAVGTQNLPVVDFVAGDFQTIQTVHQMTSLEDSIIVNVAAENGEVRTYKVFNTLLHSDVDTLRNIYVNSLPLEGFDAHKDSFIVTLPVGTRNFPTFETVRGDQWQVITAKSLSQSMYEAWNEITVTAEAGNTRTYYLGFQIAKSELATLRAIRVNGLTLTTEGLGYTADAEFAPETNTYHLNWEVGTTDMPQITYVAGDAYQVVEYLNTMRSVNDSLQIRVTAENGDVNTYTVFNTLLHSAVDTLQMIYVNNLPLESFNAHKDTFIVTLPVGTRTFPMAEAVKGERLQTLSQSVLSSTAYERVIRYTVVAEDGTTTRHYILIFRVEKSNEQMLDALLVNGELIVEQGSGYEADFNFEPSQFEYNLKWEVGTETAPVFTYEIADTLQTVYVVHEAYSANDSLVLRVEAENGEFQLYTVRNTLLHSSVDTLAMIYTDNLPVADFRGEQTVYDIALPVGRRSFPTIDYDKGDEYQYVAVDTLSVGTYEATFRIRVQAEDGVNSRAYTVHFVVTKSAKDNLEAIYLNDKLLSGFAPDVYEYEYVLLQDEPMPVITYDMADKYQTVSIIEGTPDGTAYINVMAENGSRKLYAIHFPIQRSSNAYLETITVNSKPIEDFDKDQFTYRITLPYGTTAMPIVNYTLAIPAVQRGAIEYDKDNWSAVITVTAENGTVNTYSLTFTIAKSDNAFLKLITLDGVAIPQFRQDSFEYSFTLPYGTMAMPVIAYTKSDEQQLVTITNPSQWSALITVTSGNGNNQNEYLLHFNVEQNAETRLSDLQLFGQTIAGFNSDTLNYSIVYPAGTDSTELATPENILAIAIDSLATIEILQVNAELITITVTAQNGQITVYSISQRIGLPNLALLEALFVDSTLIRHFDPETFEYTYLLPAGALLPAVDAVAQDSLATVDVTPGTVDSIPTLVYCTAQDGTELIYSVYFKTAPYNDSDVPDANDVLMRHIAGTNSYLASSIRANVQLGLYDRNGHQLLFSDVPTCNPNSAVFDTGIDDKQRLVSVDDPSDGLIVELIPGEMYFYVFFEMGKNRIDSGKIMIAK